MDFSLNPLELQAIWLTLKLALFTVLILLLVGIPLAWWLSRYNGSLKPVFEAVIALPLVLPPTVLGFYMLVVFSPDAFLGQFWFGLTGQHLAFSFSGILLGSLFYSLPFVVQPIYAGFTQLGNDYDKVAESLGIGPIRRFFSLTLAQIKPAMISAATLGFAHTLGEFGLVLMIGGNIVGETQVLSIALYNQVEALDYQSAHKLALMLISFSFMSLLFLYRYNRHFVRSIAMGAR